MSLFEPVSFSADCNLIVTLNMILRLPLLTQEQKENETDSPMRAMCVLPILLIIESLTKNFRLLCLKRTYRSFVISHVKRS